MYNIDPKNIKNFLFSCFSLLLYYYHAMNKAHEKMIVMLKDQLIMVCLLSNSNQPY